jgi:hypothetical protein
MADSSPEAPAAPDAPAAPAAAPVADAKSSATAAAPAAGGGLDLSAGLKALKHTAIRKDASKPVTSGGVTEADVSRYQLTAMESNIEQWLDALKDVTFPTGFVPLSVADARVLVEAFETLHPDKSHKAPEGKAPAALAPAAADGKELKLPERLTKELAVLQANIQKCIDNIRGAVR